MVLFNYATKELTAKIVYYGPGLCGKTTNLQFIHQNLPETVKGKMLSLATKTDRTLFFDFLPLDLGEIRGMKTRVQLYTVPGQVFYNETRKLVLKGVDGVVFVADSQQEMMGPNVESFKNLEDNLKGHGLSLADLPHVIQFNKRDLPKLASIEEINAEVNKYNAPFYESVATTGIGVKDTLNAITKLVLLHLTKKYGASATPAATRPEAAVPPPETVPIAAVPPAPAPAAPMMAAAGGEAAAGAPDSSDGGPLPPVTVGPAEELPSEPPAPKFAEAEIDELVSEVQTAGMTIPVEPSEPPPVVEEELPATEEITVEPAIEDTPTVEIPAEELDEAPIAQEAEITLTEAASDDDLFEDPNLEIARMAPGEAREIVIPVEVGSEDSGARRFKLTLRLHLDPVD
jgi:signal recognition particle receptor subunit beta